MAIVIGQLIYRYRQSEETLRDRTGFKNTIMFVLGLAFTFLASNFLGAHKNSLAIDYALYAVTIYLVGSTVEWVLHRYVMHCYQYSPWILNLSDSHVFKRKCLEHKNHHLSVNSDMSLNDSSHNNELVFAFRSTIDIVVVFFIFSLIIVRLLGIRGVPVYASAGLSVAFAFTFSMIWNSVHTKMHNKHVDVPLVPKINVPESMYQVYLKNHNLHHQIKGDDKGNFNVVFLGADELFETNNKEE